MYRKILVPVDGSPTADRGLDEAIRLGHELGAEIVLLHVVESLPMTTEVSSAETWQLLLDSMRKHGEVLLEKLGARVVAAGLAVHPLLEAFAPLRTADVILDVARQQGCDLIVMGTHGRRGIGHVMLGSDAERVLRASVLPVLLVRAPESPK